MSAAVRASSPWPVPTELSDLDAAHLLSITRKWNRDRARRRLPLLTPAEALSRALRGFDAFLGKDPT